MLKDILSMLKPLVVVFAALFLLTAVIYPVLVFIIGQAVFPYQANGSLLHNGSQVTGSELIGQPFSDPKYFWPRPSYTAAYPYNPLASGGSNYGPTNKQLISDVSNRTAYWKGVTGDGTVPADLVMGSASGLDPHISLDSALLQAPRVAQARGMGVEKVEGLVLKSAESPLAGDKIVNVVRLNLALDALDA